MDEKEMLHIHDQPISIDFNITIKFTGDFFAYFITDFWNEPGKKYSVNILSL